MYVCEDINHNIWIHPSGGGLGYYERKTNTLKPFFNTERQSGWDSENKVTAIFSDKQGNLWFGSYNNGLEKVTFNTPFWVRNPLKCKFLSYIRIVWSFIPIHIFP